jgi:hypothetical protein
VEATPGTVSVVFIVRLTEEASWIDSLCISLEMLCFSVQPSNHSLHADDGNDNHMINFNTGRGGLQLSTAVGRDWEASSAIIPTFFCGFSVIILTI